MASQIVELYAALAASSVTVNGKAVAVKGPESLPSKLAGDWYYLAFANTGTAGTLYVGKYGNSLTTVGPTTGNYTQYTLTGFQIFVSAVDACADDLLHYNRVLTADEVKQNFLSVE